MREKYAILGKENFSFPSRTKETDTNTSKPALKVSSSLRYLILIWFFFSVSSSFFSLVLQVSLFIHFLFKSKVIPSQNYYWEYLLTGETPWEFQTRSIFWKAIYWSQNQQFVQPLNTVGGRSELPKPLLSRHAYIISLKLHIVLHQLQKQQWTNHTQQATDQFWPPPKITRVSLLTIC